jgi:hypothetical protein
VKNPFVQPVSTQDRVKHAQVCPHCFAQLLTLWGQDLRKSGRCPECGKRVFRYKGAMHSLRETAIMWAAFACVALVLAGWLLVTAYR